MPQSQQLQTLLHEQIPLSAAMGVRVTAADTRSVSVTAPLAANHNHAGTVFAGSQHALACLAGWSLLRLWADAADWSADLVLGRAEIRYLQPAHGDLAATATLNDEHRHELEKARATNSAARVDLIIELVSGDDICARFHGRFVARGKAA